MLATPLGRSLGPLTTSTPNNGGNSGSSSTPTPPPRLPPPSNRGLPNATAKAMPPSAVPIRTKPKRTRKKPFGGLDVSFIPDIDFSAIPTLKLTQLKEQLNRDLAPFSVTYAELTYHRGLGMHLLEVPILEPRSLTLKRTMLSKKRRRPRDSDGVGEEEEGDDDDDIEFDDPDIHKLQVLPSHAVIRAVAEKYGVLLTAMDKRHDLKIDDEDDEEEDEDAADDSDLMDFLVDDKVWKAEVAATAARSSRRRRHNSPHAAITVLDSEEEDEIEVDPTLLLDAPRPVRGAKLKARRTITNMVTLLQTKTESDDEMSDIIVLDNNSSSISSDSESSVTSPPPVPASPSTVMLATASPVSSTSTTSSASIASDTSSSDPLEFDSEYSDDDEIEDV